MISQSVTPVNCMVLGIGGYLTLSTITVFAFMRA